jgi:hypothetical protein
VKVHTQVTVTVTQPDAISISANAASCIGSDNTFTVNQTGSTQNYTYTWSASPAVGSGVIGSRQDHLKHLLLLQLVLTYTVLPMMLVILLLLKLCRYIRDLQDNYTTQILSCVNPTGLIT